MNTPVNFELAKLLKEKGFNEKPFYIKSNTDYIEGYNFDVEDENDSLKVAEFQFEDNVCSHLYLKPTIAEVVMWLYEKHGIWINVKGDDNKTFKYELHKWTWYEPEKTLRQGHIILGNGIFDTDSKGFNSPTEAYEAALLYTLKNLI